MLDDEPGKTYYAKISGDTQIDTLVSMGTGTIKFVCPDPYAYGARKTLLLPGPSSAVTNAGLADTYPVITAKFTKSTPYFAIGNGNKTGIPCNGSDADWQADSTAAGSGWRSGWYNVGRMADGK
ncbi:phage tail family protein [Paenibacillus larvae]|nr:phage tail family protein [Paenibacillus larvae]